MSRSGRHFFRYLNQIWALSSFVRVCVCVCWRRRCCRCHRQYSEQDRPSNVLALQRINCENTRAPTKCLMKCKNTIKFWLDKYLPTVNPPSYAATRATLFNRGEQATAPVGMCMWVGEENENHSVSTFRCSGMPSRTMRGICRWLSLSATRRRLHNPFLKSSFIHMHKWVAVCVGAWVRAYFNFVLFSIFCIDVGETGAPHNFNAVKYLHSNSQHIQSHRRTSHSNRLIAFVCIIPSSDRHSRPGHCSNSLNEEFFFLFCFQQIDLLAKRVASCRNTSLMADGQIIVSHCAGNVEWQRRRRCFFSLFLVHFGTKTDCGGKATRESIIRWVIIIFCWRVFSLFLCFEIFMWHSVMWANHTRWCALITRYILHYCYWWITTTLFCCFCYFVSELPSLKPHQRSRPKPYSSATPSARSLSLPLSIILSLSFACRSWYMFASPCTSGHLMRSITIRFH